MNFEIISNYKLLPEWYPQQCILLTWPHKYSDWKKNLAAIEKTYINIIKELTPTEKILIIIYDHNLQLQVLSLLQSNNCNLNNIAFFIAKTNDTWIRDYGPLSLLSDQNKLTLLNCSFDAWNKKHNYELDNRLNQKLFDSNLIIHDHALNISTVLEGGSIDTNGIDTILTTTSCLLTRNQGKFEIKSYDALLKKTFNVKHIIWLNNAFLFGDDTDGHIDNFARFINPKTIVYLSCNDPTDLHYSKLSLLKKELVVANKSLNNKFDLIPLPIPKPIYKNNSRLPASYINFLITNKVVLVPVFTQNYDDMVLELLQSNFKDKKVIGINANELITQGGGIHCATMQVAKI